VTDPRFRQIKILILPRCPEARGNIDFDHAWRDPHGITSAHHQTVFEPPFMTSIGPATASHEPSIAVPIGSPNL
jgi:hypothetical protein